jgi:hypothetical protein
MTNSHRQILRALCTGLAALLLAGCAATSIQYPPFPDQTKKVEDPTKARIYAIRPPGGMNAKERFKFWGAGPAATGPKVDPREWIPAVPQLGIYPPNPSPDSPWRMIGEIAAGSYICWEEPPDVLTMRNNAPMNLLAGNVYYLRVTMPALGNARAEPIDEKEGQALLKKSRPPAGY